MASVYQALVACNGVLGIERDWVEQDEEDPENSKLATKLGILFQVYLRSAVIVVQNMLQFDVTGHCQLKKFFNPLGAASSATQEARRLMKEYGHIPSNKDLAELCYLRAFCYRGKGDMAFAMVLMDKIEEMKLELDAETQSRYDAERDRICEQWSVQSRGKSQKNDYVEIPDHE